MKKVLKKRSDKKVLPQIVQNHHLESQYNSGELVVDIGIDPDDINQKVTRLRRKCVYDEMMNRGSISVEQRNCAERYAILCEKAFGQSSSSFARISNWLKEGKTTNANWGPRPAQHEAYNKLLYLWQELGQYHRNILNMIILGNMNSKEISKFLNLNLNYTMGQILSAFILLEEAFKNR